ncbi:MAG: DNA-binding response regulator [Clostridiales bacterium GWF2_36_10]|nr:MAG: DNA-binding response regulator [Clostridiales bacterium GWF2_36_10]HAN22081.1 DNA-binding response regulator [Clostridiales bacterium]
MIYCVEDDRSIRELVVYTLQNTGYSTAGFEKGAELFIAIRAQMPELILLDIMLPDLDGIGILKRLRSDASTKKIPVIMLTAKGTEYDKIIGLDSGADDYITKPFGMMELISRIKAVLRRTNSNNDEIEYSFGKVKINTKAHSILVDGVSVELTLKEFELLHLMMKNAGIVLTRDMLLENIWGYNFDGETRTIDVHIRTLRTKLGSGGDIIETVRGVGYRIGD